MPMDDVDLYENFDVDAVSEDIGASLFPNKETEDPGQPEGGEEHKVSPPPPPSPSPPPAIVSGQNSVGKALPKSWKKDMAPHWEKLPPEVHDYVYAREADVMRGIQQYQTGYQQWDSLIKPFAPLLQEHPDVNPVQLMQGLMNTHLQFLNPSLPKEKKLELLQNIASSYGLAVGNETPPPDSALQTELRNLRSELSALKHGFTTRQRQEYDAGVAAKEQEVASFAAENEHFDEVANDIFRFIQTGAASDLKSAYDLACWANPSVRAKMVAKQQTSATESPRRNGKTGQFVNLESEPQPPARKMKPGSIDQTIDAIVASHYSKH